MSTVGTASSRGHPRQSLVVAEDQGGCREFRGVTDLVGCPPSVVETDHRAHRDESEVGDHPVGGVRGEDGDTVALDDAVIVRQRRGLRGDEVGETVVGDATVVEDEELGVAVGCGREDEVAQ